nr:reverse transcriptase [Tanacetum cinerariifolium]
LPRTQRRHDAIWVVVDRLTKSAHFLPIHKDYSISKLAETFQLEIVRLHGNWDDYICLVEFAYNNSWHASIKCAPFEMLCGRKCRAPICWDQVGERVIEGPEMIEVSPARGVRRFGMKGKLSPRFIGPFEILDRIGEVSYCLALPPQLSHVYNVFHISLLRGPVSTPAGITRDVFVSVGKFTFPADFFIVDYESDHIVPLILERPFLRTARALIDVHGEEMILRDDDERLTLNMRHDTSSYSNQPQKESINLFNVFNNSSEDFLEDLFSTNQPSGNPTFSSHPKLTSSEVKDDISDPEGGNVLSEKLLDLDSTKDLHPPLHVNQLSGITTYSSYTNQLLEELADELALIIIPPKYDDDLQFDIDNLANLADNFVNSMPEMFTDEHALDYSSHPIFDEYDDDLFEVEYDTENVYDDPSTPRKRKSKKNFSRVDALSSTNNEDKVFNPCILIQENLFEIISHVVQDKKLAISNASLMLEDFDPPLYEPFFFKEVPRSNMPLPFSSENKEKVFKQGIHNSEKVHSSRFPELSHQGYKVFKINQIFKSSMKIFLFSCRKDTHILDVPCLQFYPLDQFKYGGIGSS